MPQPTSAESDDNRACFGFPAIAGKKFSAGFDGGRLTSDGGVLLLGHPRGLRQRLPRGGYVPADRSRPLPGADLASAAVPPTPPPVQKLRKPLESPR